LGSKLSWLKWVGLRWVGFSYQNLYIFRYYDYQTGISLFTSDCSHLVFLAVVWIQATVSNYVVDDDDYDEIGDLHIFAFLDIFSCVLLQLMHHVDVCCWVGLGRVRSAYIFGLGWV